MSVSGHNTGEVDQINLWKWVPNNKLQTMVMTKRL